MALSNPKPALNIVPRAEAEGIAADMRAQERGDSTTRTVRTSPTYVRATSPSGDAVVYVPGEALPEWVVAKLDAGRGRIDAETGAVILP
ncbi:hypothetical protein [Actinoplanes sp. HUAS TT8]|uniref:hypothetical protein n=1 Tax=Actinoplanes sp. HUAS TT8 TaxID=3447453 RepID=UPI003F523C73